MAWIVSFGAFTGCSPLPERADKDEARALVAARLRRARRRGLVVATLEAGRRWEITGADDAVMVSDAEGVLELEAERFECGECGGVHEDREAAAACCLEAGEDYDAWRDWARDEDEDEDEDDTEGGE